MPAYRGTASGEADETMVICTDPREAKVMGGEGGGGHQLMKSDFVRV
jgi:hypothetical protein